MRHSVALLGLVCLWVGARFPWTSDWGSHPVGESHGNQEEDHARNEAKA